MSHSRMCAHKAVEPRVSGEVISDKSSSRSRRHLSSFVWMLAATAATASLLYSGELAEFTFELEVYSTVLLKCPMVSTDSACPKGLAVYALDVISLQVDQRSQHVVVRCCRRHHLNVARGNHELQSHFGAFFFDGLVEKN